MKNTISLQASNIALWLTADLLKHAECYNIPPGLAFNHSAFAHDLRMIQLNTLGSFGLHSAETMGLLRHAVSSEILHSFFER